MVRKKSEQGTVPMGEGIRRTSLVYGKRTHLVAFGLKKGSSIPRHAHPHEQTGYLLAGKVSLTIDGVGHDMEPGDSWCIEPDVPHAATVTEDARILEVFSPLREDYL